MAAEREFQLELKITTITRYMRISDVRSHLDLVFCTIGYCGPYACSCQIVVISKFISSNVNSVQVDEHQLSKE
jgi:hypothetical protein